jgi:hypothetical protein
MNIGYAYRTSNLEKERREWRGIMVSKIKGKTVVT